MTFLIYLYISIAGIKNTFFTAQIALNKVERPVGWLSFSFFKLFWLKLKRTMQIQPNRYLMSAKILVGTLAKILARLASPARLPS